jgi:SAM-dependent methyltransferase
MAPEVLTDPREPVRFDLVTSHYAEAYNETPFYDAEATDKANQIISASSLVDIPFDGLRRLGQVYRLSPDQRANFPNPPLRWLAAGMDLGSEWDCYTHLAPVQNKIVLQLGGSGGIAMILLLAGAAEAILLTPMLGEARLALKVAQVLGLSDRFRCVVGIAEEIPLPATSLDIAFSGGCVHHMATELAFPEIARVLRPGGRFAAIEPWRAPLYSLGTRIFGKREPNPFCRPLTRDRVAPLFDAFPNAKYVQHGALTRYPMLAMQKLGARFSHETAWTVGRIDDRVCSCIPGLRRFGSGVALLATA